MSGGRSQLRYRDTLEPTKPPVLLLHGFLGDARDWDEIIAEIGAEFRVIAVDLPGHGQSLGLPDVHYSIDGCARQIVSLVEDLKLAQVAVCGYSMGGRLALYLAVHYPARFSQVILESATAGIRSEQERRERHDQDHARAKALESSSLAVFLRTWYHQPLFSSFAKRPELLERIIEMRELGD
ncbi:MAG: alpha/beta fold hydrolase, partial [candidate division Zixibacteria bacterium]|nr:alpha/beta fold hydrolase [candidate division Zixibacteria bacterium]